MRQLALLLAGLAALAAAPWAAASAGTLEQVREVGRVRCGAVPRAGFAEADEDGRVAGLAVDLCRALAIGVLGPAARVEFRLYSSAQAFETVRDGADDVAFLTAEDVRAQRLASRLIPGPVVFVAELAALARPGLTDLAGRTVCFLSGTAAHQALEAWAARTRTAIVRSGFQEEGEMHDAFDARRCDAMMGEVTALARLPVAPPRGSAAILPPFGVMPVFTATHDADGAWASLTGWALAAAVQSERDPGPWRGDFPGVAGGGLRPGWQAEVLTALGGYDDMVQRALGHQPMSGAAAHGNALWPSGLLLPQGPH